MSMMYHTKALTATQRQVIDLKMERVTLLWQYPCCSPREIK